MVDAKSKWEDELRRWLKPFLDRLGHKARRRMCPLYISGLIGPGDRKSVQSSRAIAEQLTEQGIEPPRGGAWSNKTVLRMMARLGLKG